MAPEAIVMNARGNPILKFVSGFVVLLLLSACASSSGVFRVDENKYQISTRATWELGGRAGARRMALEEATRYCKTRGKVLKVLTSSEDYGHFEGAPSIWFLAVTKTNNEVPKRCP